MQNSTPNPNNKGLPKKKAGRSLFRRINGWLHLWLGLTSGIVVLIVSLTGCIYAFEREIRDYIEPYQFVTPQSAPYLPPSRLKAIAAHAAFGNKADSMALIIQGVAYGTKDKAAMVAYTDKAQGYTLIYINPYSGDVLHKKVFSKDFFRFILNGHYYLWLPPKIGQPVVAIAVLVFVLLLLTGMILWWPRNLKKANVNKSFKIKWNASFKRVNYDLHNVFGFYVLLIAFVIAATGLVWGFQWFARTVYWTASAGGKLPTFKRPVSDTTARYAITDMPPEDKIMQLLQKEGPMDKGSFQIQFPMKRSDPYSLMSNPDEGVYYRRTFRFFDRNTLQELQGGGVYGKTFAGSSGADKLNRMNYDIHTGAVLGLAGKILAFFASLICASLPVTGFLVWWGKRKK